MKKILGLLVTVAIGSMVACNESGETAVAPAYQNPSQQQAQNPQVNSDSIYQHVLDSIAAAQTMSSSVVAEDPFAGQLLSSSSDLTPVLVNSSSDIALLSSSSIATLSSSSVATLSSSSANVVTPKSSAAADVDDGLFKLGLWDGTAGDNQVPTGNKTGGYWYYYDDSGDKGKSKFTWSVDVDGTNGFADLIKECGGVCGDFDLVVGNNKYKPYVGIGFNYSKSDKTAADATSSKGVCVTYKSTLAINLEMGLGSLDASIGYANPFVSLPKSTSANTVDFSWSEFEQPSWATEIVTNPQKKLVSLKFKFAGTTDGEDGGSGSFNIMKVGASGQCD